MNILHFKLDEELLSNNIILLSNLIKANIFNYQASIFDHIDIDDDIIEPTLFYSLLMAKEKQVIAMPVLQSLWGFMENRKKPKTIPVNSDGDGIINLPNYGNFKSNYKNASLTLHYDALLNEVTFSKKGKKKEHLDFIKNLRLKGSDIIICNHTPNLLNPLEGTIFNKPIVDTVSTFYPFISKAWKIMLAIVPDYCHLIKNSVKEICIFDSPNQYSKASFGYLGTAFINVQNQNHDEVFFIDDIAHQCGHIIFYTLTIPFNDYFKVDFKAPLKTFNEIEWEKRDIYGCFHGLFTYSTILFCLEKCIKMNIFKGKKKHETLGRFAFYMDKFRKDIANMNDPKILSEKGFAYFDMFKQNYDYLYDTYKITLRNFDFSNQNYLFNYPLFAELNPLK